MATPPLPDKLAQQALDAWAKHGSIAGAALALNIPHATVDSRVRLARHRGMKPTVKLSDKARKHAAENISLRAQLAAERKKKAAPDGPPLSERERQRYDDRITALQRQLKDANREINAGEDL